MECHLNTIREDRRIAFAIDVYRRVLKDPSLFDEFRIYRRMEFQQLRYQSKGYGLTLTIKKGRPIAERKGCI